MTNVDCKTVRICAYSRAVKQKVWNEAENRERDWEETLKIWACEARELRALKSHTPRFTDFFTDFEKKTDFIKDVNIVHRGVR